MWTGGGDCGSATGGEDFLLSPVIHLHFSNKKHDSDLVISYE